MKYGGVDATSIFPVQVCILWFRRYMNYLTCLVGPQVSALCDGKDGAVNPYVILDSTNQTVNTDAQYYDFRPYQSNDYRPDWYYEMMI